MAVLLSMICPKIKFPFVIGLLSVVLSSAVAQMANTNLVASSSGDNRMEVVKASIPLTEWHEKSFWKQYKSYWGEIQKASFRTYALLQSIAEMDKLTDNAEAFEEGCNMIASRFNELSIRRQYFIEIGVEHNGVIGLQFIQTEVMLDIVECSRLYEETAMKNFRFLPKKFSAKQVKQAKHNILTRALALTPEEAAKFLPVYIRYEEEADQTLGEEYNLYELYVSEASEFTPMLARRQGYDLLTIMERELKLKEKYFIEMNSIVGAPIAARFLAWEDYYSLICKMNAWMEAR